MAEGRGEGEKEKKDGGEELGFSWADGNGSLPKPLKPARSPCSPAPLGTERRWASLGSTFWGEMKKLCVPSHLLCKDSSSRENLFLATCRVGY